MTVGIDIKPDAAQMGIAYNVQSFNSTLNGFQQFKELSGSRWVGSFTWSNRQGLEARTLSAQLTSLRGQIGEFRISPPDHEGLGTALGTGLVNGGGQTGSSIITDGWTPNQTILLEIGDYFELNGELKQATSRAASNGSGVATIEFQPPIRRSPANNSAVVTVEPRATMRLVSPISEHSLSAPVVYAISIEAEEVV